MSRRLFASAALALLSAPLSACVYAPSPDVSIAHCRLGWHTEAYPLNRHPRHAYRCVSDTTGYLRRPGDEREHMRPEPAAHYY